MQVTQLLWTNVTVLETLEDVVDVEPNEKERFEWKTNATYDVLRIQKEYCSVWSSKFHDTIE